MYNPQNKKFYNPDIYQLDPHHITGAIYPDHKYDGDLFCSLKCDGFQVQEESFPPGTRVEHPYLTTNVLQSGTVMNIPLHPSIPDDSKH